MRTHFKFGRVVGRLSTLGFAAGRICSARSFGLANEDHGAGGNVAQLVGMANDFAIEGDWIQISPLGDFPHERGIQRVDAKAVAAMANEFNSLRARLSRRFGGLPFYVGHPDVPALANQFPDRKAYGWVEALEAREDGLYGKVKWSAPGQELLANSHYKFFSPYWNAEQWREGGKQHYRPLQLVSVGLTNKPNIPVNPLANTEGTKDTENFMQRQELITALGLANEATDEQIKTRLAAIVAASATLATIQAEKANATTALENERNAKTTLETKVTSLTTALANERKARAELIVGNAIRDGRITEAQRGQWVTDLANAADETVFTGKVTALANERSNVKTESVTRGMGGRRGQDLVALENERNRRGQVAELVTAKQSTGLNYDAAWAAVQRENPELFKQMHSPETGE